MKPVRGQKCGMCLRHEADDNVSRPGHTGHVTERRVWFIRRLIVGGNLLHPDDEVISLSLT